MRCGSAVLITLFFISHQSSAGIDVDVPAELDKKDETQWHYALSTSTYLVLNGRDYTNPNFAADRDWLHVEARYDYEALKTGSIWLGYSFSFGNKLVLEPTPMVRWSIRRQHWHRARVCPLS